MPDTAVIENEDALAADFDEAGEEEERPQTFAELGVPGPLVRVLAADGKKTAFPIQADTLPAGISCPVVLVTVAFRWYPEVSVNTAVEELMDNIPSVDSADVADSMALADGVGAYNNINAMVNTMARMDDNARRPRETCRCAD